MGLVRQSFVADCLLSYISRAFSRIRYVSAAICSFPAFHVFEITISDLKYYGPGFSSCSATCRGEARRAKTDLSRRSSESEDGSGARNRRLNQHLACDSAAPLNFIAILVSIESIIMMISVIETDLRLRARAPPLTAEHEHGEWPGPEQVMLHRLFPAILILWGSSKLDRKSRRLVHRPTAIPLLTAEH